MLGLGLTEILTLLVLGAVLLFQYGKEKRKLPPGPRGLPLVGNLFQMMDNAHLKMSEWANKYGKIYKLQMGSKTTIVLNDFKLIKELMQDTSFADRPHSKLIEQLSGGPYGVITTNGRAWEEQRRWTLRKLRDFGFGKTSMDGMIMEEVNETIAIIQDHGEKPLQVNGIFDLAVLNALWTLMNGDRLSIKDPKIREVLDTHHKVPEVISGTGLLFAPWLKYIFPSSQRLVDIAADKVMKFSRDAVAQHWNTFEDGVSRDFIDEYISEIRKTTDKTSSFYGDVGRKQLEGTVSDLLQAGTETTSNTLSWLLCYITEFPKVQEKIQMEIDRVTGSSKQVSLTDRPLLPYVEATIFETLRYSSLIAMGVQRSPSEDRMVEGYLFPKGCWVFPNLYYIHHSPAIWGDPENFRPERFLSADGTKVEKPEALIPFQLGRRQCLGESLAKDTLFLFASNLLQKFHITRIETEAPRHSHGGMFMVPKTYHYVFKSRVTM